MAVKTILLQMILRGGKMFLEKFLFKINHLMKNGNKLVKYFTGIETTYEIVKNFVKNLPIYLAFSLYFHAILWDLPYYGL